MSYSAQYQDHPSNESMPISDESSESTEMDEYVQTKLITIFMCVPSPGFERFFRTYIPIFDILLVAVIPFFLLCCTNVGIIIYTMRNNRRMRQHRKRSHHRRHQRLTVMLLSVTLAFIGLTCPSVIFICVNKIIFSMHLQSDRKTVNLNELVGLSQPANVQIIVDICEALWYTKHAMNFILYTLSGQDFRREFRKLFTQCFRQRPSVLKTLMRTTQASSAPTMNSSLIEIPVSAPSTTRKKPRKLANHDCDISSAVTGTSKTSPMM